MTKRFYQGLICCLGFAVDSAAVFAALQDSIPVQVQLKSGTVINAEVESQSIEWMDIDANGESRQRRVNLSELARLQLAGESVAKLVETSRQLIAELDAQDYRQREAAERTLIQRMEGTQAANLKPLLETAGQSQILEVRYRIERILKTASNQAPQANRLARSDLLQLQGQPTVSGDAGALLLALQRNQQELKLGRDEVRQISVVKSAAELIRTQSNAPPLTAALGWTSSQLPIDTARRSELLLLDFESDPFGLPLVKDPNQKLDRLFANQGLLMSTAAGVGHIGISPFFKMIFAGRPTAENSICVFDTRGTLKRRHIGITEFEFCLPGQPASAAGVHQFEIYLGEINHPRDFIMQAFNVDGQIVATVEASDELGCCFQVESREPIALIRILSNPYLFELKRDIDNDYAMDNISFSPPVPVTGIQNKSGLLMVRNWQNESFVASQYTFMANGSLEFECEGLVGKQTLDKAEIESMVLPQAQLLQPQPNLNRWYALLNDHSVVEVTAGENFSSTRFPDWTIEKERLCAVWSAADYLRFPVAEDFSAGQPILVFPTGRVIAPDLQVNATGLDWSAASSVKQLQQVFLRSVTEDERVKQKSLREEDPTPRFTQMPWANPNVNQWPSIWWSPPPPADADLGCVWLSNGEIYRFGGQSGWKFGAWEPQQFVLEHDSGRRLVVTWPDVMRVALPAKRR